MSLNKRGLFNLNGHTSTFPGLDSKVKTYSVNVKFSSLYTALLLKNKSGYT